MSEGLNDTAENLLRSIARNEEEVSPSTIFAVASILEKVTDNFRFCPLMLVTLNQCNFRF